MGEGLELKAITEFVDSGRNLLIFSGPEASESVRTMAAEFGLEGVFTCADALGLGHSVSSAFFGSGNSVCMICTHWKHQHDEASKSPTLTSADGIFSCLWRTQKIDKPGNIGFTLRFLVHQLRQYQV